MRNYPEDKYDQEELKTLNAEPWQLDLLRLNPEYCGWGVHEDYMSKEGSGWDSRQIKDSWKDFSWSLDDLNECVNFYFEVSRESKSCDACGQSGYNSATAALSKSYYNHSSPTGRGWSYDITQDEVQALVDAGRLHDLTSIFVPGEGWKKKDPSFVPTAAEVNAWARKGIGHDSINQHILVQARAKRLGVYGLCPSCHGNGYVHTAPSAHVSLMLWILHPRKGCSRGVEVTRIEQEDLPSVFAWLREARDRNAERFAKIPG